MTKKDEKKDQQMTKKDQQMTKKDQQMTEKKDQQMTKKKTNENEIRLQRKTGKPDVFLQEKKLARKKKGSKKTWGKASKSQVD